MSKRRTPRYLRDGGETPRTPALESGRIAADLSKQAPNNSLSGRLFYQDQPFTCVDCGKEEIWTAKQQQWWYEVANGPIYSRAIRCRACRQARRQGGGPAPEQPIRHVGTLMKLVRAEIEPALLANGFVPAVQHMPRQAGERAWIDYQRDGRLLSIAFERPPRLVAELLNENGNCRTVAVVEFDRPTRRAEIVATIQAFGSAVRQFLTITQKDVASSQSDLDGVARFTNSARRG